MTALRSRAHESVAKSCWKFFVRKYHGLIQESRSPGNKFVISSTFGLSAITGSVSLWPQIGYCTNGFKFEVDDRPTGMLDDFHTDEDRRALLSFIRKMLVPIILFTTVLMNWGHPFIIAAKVAIILFTTKPSPLSMCLYVEQLQHQSVWQRPFMYPLKSYFAEEVEDYMLLCLGRVKLKDKKLVLVGILGDWWVLPASSWQEAFSMLSSSAFFR